MYKHTDESEFNVDKLLEGVSLPEPIETQGTQRNKLAAKVCDQQIHEKFKALYHVGQKS